MYLSSYSFQSFYIYFLFIEGQLLYNVVLVSAVQQCESAIIIHIHPFPTTLPPFIPLGHHWTLFSLLYSSFPLAIYLTHGSVYISMQSCVRNTFNQIIKWKVPKEMSGLFESDLWHFVCLMFNNPVNHLKKITIISENICNSVTIWFCME